MTSLPGIAQGPAAGSGLGWLDRVIRAKVIQPIDSIPEFLKSWTSWGVTLGYFFAQGTVSVILGWLPTYLVKVKQFSIMDVGFVAAAPFVGAVLGNIVGGWRVRSRVQEAAQAHHDGIDPRDGPHDVCAGLRAE